MKDTDTPLVGPWSHSRATSCSLNLLLKVLHAEPEPQYVIDEDRRMFGVGCHLGAEMMMRGRLKEGKWPNPEKVATAVVGDLSILAPQFPEIVYRLDLFTKNFEFTPENALGNEMKIAIDGQGRLCSFDKCPPDGWRAKIDYAESDGKLLVITDFKNRPAVFPKSELKFDEQVTGLYPHLLKKVYQKLETVRVAIYYFEFGYHQFYDTTWEEIEENTLRLKAEAKRKMSLTLAQIGPEPGPKRCGYCDWLGVCEAGKDIMEEGVLKPGNQDSASELARWIIVTDAKLKRAKGGLKAWAKDFGQVPIEPGMNYGFNLTTQKEWDVRKVFKYLESKGLDPFDYLKVASDDMKEFQRGAENEVIKTMYNEKKGTEFTVLKAPELKKR